MSSEWFYVRGNTTVGPLTWAELQDLVRSGQLLAGQIVRDPRTLQWTPAGTVAGLFGYVEPKRAEVTDRPRSNAEPPPLPKKQLRDEQARPTRSRPKVRIPWQRVLKHVKVATILAALAVGGIIAFRYVTKARPLAPYAHTVPDRCDLVVAIDLNLLRKAPGLKAEQIELEQRLADAVKDLRLNPARSMIMSLFAARSVDGRFIVVWTFDKPIAISEEALNKGLFEAKKTDAGPIYLDNFAEGWAWAVDGKGRLLHGMPSVLEAALAREKARKSAAAFDELARLAEELPDSPLLWAAASFSGTADKAPNLPDDIRINRLLLALHDSDTDQAKINGKAYFPKTADAQRFQDLLRNMGPDSRVLGAVPLLGALTKCLETEARSAEFNPAGNEMSLLATASDERVRRSLQELAKDQADVNVAKTTRVTRRRDEFASHAEKILKFEKLQKAKDVLQNKKLEEAIDSLERAAEVDPQADRLKVLLKQAKSGLSQLQPFLDETKCVEKEIDAGNLDNARKHLQNARTWRPSDPSVAELAQKLRIAEEKSNLAAIEKEFKSLRRELAELKPGDGYLGRAEQLVEKFSGKHRDHFGALQYMTTIQRIKEAQGLMETGQESLEKDTRKAIECGEKLKDLVKNDWAKVFPDGTPFEGLRPSLQERAQSLALGIAGCLTKEGETFANQAAEAFQKKAFDRIPEQCDKGSDQLNRATAFFNDFNSILPSLRPKVAEVKNAIRSTDETLDRRRSSVGTLILKTETAIGIGIKAWVEFEGKEKFKHSKDWEVGKKEVRITVPVGTYRVIVKSDFGMANRVGTIRDKKGVEIKAGTQTVNEVRTW